MIQTNKQYQSCGNLRILWTVRVSHNYGQEKCLNSSGKLRNFPDIYIYIYIYIFFDPGLTSTSQHENNKNICNHVITFAVVIIKNKTEKKILAVFATICVIMINNGIISNTENNTKR